MTETKPTEFFADPAKDPNANAPGDAGAFDPAEKVAQESESMLAHLENAITHLLTYGKVAEAETLKWIKSKIQER